MIFGPIVIYAHEDTDEDAEDYFSDKEMAPWSPEQREAARVFLDSNPLYEVRFEFYLDAETGDHYCTKINLGHGVPFTRHPPGEQLSLFGQDEPDCSQ